MPRKRKKNWTYAVGRRRAASARVRLFKGRGENLVNDKPFSEYFPGAINEEAYTEPFKIADVGKKYYVTVKVIGGGKSGQLDATVHGIARVLDKADREKFRPSLKKAGLLTRDARVRERRKVGMGGKARRKKQSPKR